MLSGPLSQDMTNSLSSSVDTPVTEDTSDFTLLRVASLGRYSAQSSRTMNTGINNAPYCRGAKASYQSRSCAAKHRGQQLKINFSWIRRHRLHRRSLCRPRTKAVGGISYWLRWQAECTPLWQTAPLLAVSGAELGGRCRSLSSKPRGRAEGLSSADFIDKCLSHIAKTESIFPS